MEKKKKILILGCGWAGKITARLFLEANFEVWGSNTKDISKEELDKMGIGSLTNLYPLRIDFSMELPKENISPDLRNIEFDLVLISVPVKRNEGYEECLTKFENLVSYLTRLSYKQVVYLSSIGVYKDQGGTITELSEVKGNGSIFKIEEFLKESIHGLVILRLGGLFGFGRIPGRYFSNKTVSVGNEKANYVHGTDVARAIFGVHCSGILSGTFNVVSPIHSLKKDIYKEMAEKYNFPPVNCLDEEGLQKEISSKKIMEAIDFRFHLPSPLSF